MSRSQDHLLSAEQIARGERRLSELTGLSRMQIEMRTLTTQDNLTIEAAGEWFLYVLRGSGRRSEKKSIFSVDGPGRRGTVPRARAIQGARRGDHSHP